MVRKLVIIGNGLGMSLNPNKFSLKEVMPKVWKGLSCQERELISSCIDGIEKTGPTSEGQLMGAQLAQLGHELISSNVEPEKQDIWFTKKAIDYPEAISTYIYEVARRLDSNSKSYEKDPKLIGFFDAFVPFVHNTKSHIATLNYDTLLYSAFNAEYNVGGKTYKVCNGWNGSLVDGYTYSQGFAEDNFVRQYGNDFGFYLHLHGSPLIVSDGENDTKLNRNEVASHNPQSARNIILSDAHFKSFLIMRSKVLSLYWEQLNTALGEASEIILFGYGGGDFHLNELLKSRKTAKRVIVRDKETEAERMEAVAFWQKQISSNAYEVVENDVSDTSVFFFESILDFSDW